MVGDRIARRDEADRDVARAGRSRAAEVARRGRVDRSAELVAAAPASDGASAAAAHRAERPANSLDRYSLGLQLLQVFPIVSGAVLALVTIAWLARVLAAAVLLAGAVWAIWQDRARRADQRHRADAYRPQKPRTVLAQPDEYHVSIRVGPTPAAFRRRYRRLRLREVRSRPSPPAPPRAESPRGGRLHYGSSGPGVIARRNPAPGRNDFPGC